MASFPIDLYDGSGYRWSIRQDSTIWHGTRDAYDGSTYRYNLALTERGNREVVFEASPYNDIHITRKIYVPEHEGWVRYLEAVTNTGSTDATSFLDISGNPGPNSSTHVIGTSSGDSAVTADDKWVVTDDRDRSWDPTLLHVVAGDGAAVQPDRTVPEDPGVTFCKRGHGRG